MKEKEVMNKAGDSELIVKKVEEIEKEVYELTEEISLGGRGMGILRTGLRKTAVSAASNIAQGVSEFKKKEGLMYLQESLAQLRTLDYYNFISRKIGYFSSSQYLRLKEMVRDITERVSLSLKDLKGQDRDGFFTASRREKSQPGLEKEEKVKPRVSSRGPNKEGGKPLIS